MPTNSDGRWSSPKVRAPCKVETLAAAINDYCDWTEGPGRIGQRELSPEGVKRLIDLAFYASLQKEEGRSPGFRLFAGSPQGELRVAFDDPLEVNRTTIRRLAPAIANINHALWVAEKHGAFQSGGIVSIVEDRVITLGCIFNSAFEQTKPGLHVRVLGPGHLRATAGGLTWDWNAGKLTRVSPFNYACVVGGWVNDLARNILGRTGADPVGRWHLYRAITNVWSLIVESVVAGGHGGAFVIVPKAREDLIKPKYRSSNTNLLNSIVQFWKSYRWKFCEGSQSWHDEAIDPWNAIANEHRLRSAAQAMAELANVDGCVVLDRELQLKGFGGEILVNASKVAKLQCHTGFLPKGEEIAKEKDGQYQLWNCPCEDRDARAGRCEELNEMGTRHLSAIRLCAALPGTLAFVVSQDRGLSIAFGEDSEHVWLWRSLDSSSRPLNRA